MLRVGLRLIGFLAASLFAGHAFAETPRLENLYFALWSTLAGPRSPQGLQVLNPTRFVNEWTAGFMDAGSSSTVAFAQLIDGSGTGWIEGNNASRRFSRIYHDILFDAEWAKIPLSSTQRKTLDDVGKKLFVDVSQLRAR